MEDKNNIFNADEAVHKADSASNDAFDNSADQLGGLSEDIQRKKLSRQMTQILAYGLGLLTLIFFTISFCKAYKYLEEYKDLLRNKSIDKDNLIAYLVPFIPYTLMTTLGLICMITLARVVSNYSNNSDASDMDFIPRLINAIGNAFKGKDSS